MLNIEALKGLYVKLGGALTDTYSDIGGGVPVGDYTLLADGIQAITKKASAGGGGGSDVYLAEIGVDMQTGDFTLDDIDAVFEAAQTKAVVGLVSIMGNAIAMPLISAMAEGDTKMVAFLMVMDGLSTLAFDSNSSVGVATPISSMPEPKSNKILYSVEDSWTTVLFPSATDASNSGKLIGIEEQGGGYKVFDNHNPTIVTINNGTADMGYTDITRVAGTRPIIATINSGSYVLNYAGLDTDGVTPVAVFTCIFTDGGVLKVKKAAIAADNSATVTDHTLTVS